MNGYNFTDRVRRVLRLAREEAARLHHEYVGTEHILLGLIREGEGVAATVLTNLNVDLEEISRRIEETVKKGTAAGSAGPDLPYTSRAKKILEFAMMEARELNHRYVGTEHLLLGVLREEKGIGAQVLTDAGVTLETARSEVLQVLGTNGWEASRKRPRDPPPLPSTPGARASLQLALQEARGLRAASLGPELLLLGVLRVLLTTPAGSAGANGTGGGTSGLVSEASEPLVPSTCRTSLRAVSSVMPASVRTCAPMPFSSRRTPRRRCSVPTYRWFSSRASLIANSRIFFARDV